MLKKVKEYEGKRGWERFVLNQSIWQFSFITGKRNGASAGCADSLALQRLPIKWLRRSIPQMEQENIELAGLIREYDDRFNHILGSRRMTAWINHFNGTHYSKNRIHRIMKAIHIRSVIRKQPPKYKRSTPERTTENLLKRDFYARSSLKETLKRP